MSNVVPSKKDAVKTIESVDSILKYERIFTMEDNRAYMRVCAPDGRVGWYIATDTGFDFIMPDNPLEYTMETTYQAYKKEQQCLSQC